MWSMKVIILLLFCYARPLTGKVYFVSKNFNNVLHWDPVESASPEEKVLYNVQYKSDAMDQFQIKKECQNITALLCDLTAETASVYDIQYEARVFVNGSCHGRTTRFKPIAETIFGPPNLFTYTTVSSLHVNVTLPEGPNGISIADIINRSTNGHSKNVIIYTLEITEPKWAALVNKTTSGRFVIRLSSQTQYCGHVSYKTLAEWGRSESQNAPFCATLTGDHRMLLPWLLISAALLAAIVTMLVVYTCNYTKGGKQNRMPSSLGPRFPTQHKALQPPDENLNVYKAQICTTKTVYTTILAKPKVPSMGNGGYSPQDITFQDCTGSSVGTEEGGPIPNPQDTSSQSSEIYSAVVVHVPAEENKGMQQATTEDQKHSNLSLSSSAETWNKGGISSTQATIQDLDATESNLARPLTLNTVRNPNGKLLLSSLVFQLQSNTGEVSPLPSERKPLLSDLIDNKMEGPSLASLQSFDISDWSDSGCDDSTINTPTTIYSPSQPDFPQSHVNSSSCDTMFQSAYKQNWMPQILLGAAGKDNCDYKRNNFP